MYVYLQAEIAFCLIFFLFKNNMNDFMWCLSQLMVVLENVTDQTS